MMPKKSKFAESYWEKRRQLEDAARLKMENETIKELTSIFPDALKQIQETLLSQADLHDISLQDLLALPTKRTQEEYRKYIDARYQELMESDDAYQEFIDEFFPAYDYAKVNRLTQIRADIFSIMTAEMMKKDVNQKFNDRLEDILQRSYSSNANALTYLLGGDFHQLPKRKLEEMLNYPWTGKTFSQRLWGNVSKLEERLSNAIVNSVGAGKGMRDILATMKNDPQVSTLFKREEDKFDNAIENLVRTEYAHFAVEGIKKSFEDTGVKKAVSWSAEDERVCSICGGMHGKEVKENESGPPYHGRCRCTLMPKMPELDTAAIDAEYEALFGDLLDEFAKDGFGVKLSHPKKTGYNKDRYNFKEIFEKNGMKNAVGEKNFDDFIEHLTNNPNDNVRRIFAKYGDQVTFSKLSNAGGNYATGSNVQLNQKAFDGRKISNPLQVVYHEIAHAIDSLGVKSLYGNKEVLSNHFKKIKFLGKYEKRQMPIRHISDDPKYKLGETITRDLWEYANGEGCITLDDLGPKPRKKSEKEAWLKKQEEAFRNYEKLKEKINSLKDEAKENPKLWANISDIIGGTKVFSSSRVFAVGHDNDYWKDGSAQTTEFFAEITDTLATHPEEYENIKKMFPNAVDIYYKIVEELLGG